MKPLLSSGFFVRHFIEYRCFAVTPRPTSLLGSTASLLSNPCLASFEQIADTELGLASPSLSSISGAVAEPISINA
jgi:hypothetical protein